MPTGQQFASTAPQTNLVGGINNSQVNSITVASFTGFPSTPFTIVFDIGTASQEACDVLTVSGNTVTNCTRGVDGTSAQAHSNNATATHVAIGRDFREARAHIDASASNDSTGHSVHGLTSGSSVVGTTDTQTLTNKTLTTPVINGSGGALALPAGPATLADTASAQTFTNKTLTSPTINTPTLTSPSTNDLIVTGLTGAANSSRYVGSTTGGPPTSGTFSVGDYVVDQNWGIFWTCITAGTPGTWSPSGMALIKTDTPPNVGWTSIPSYFTNLRITWSAIGGAVSGGNGFDEIYLRFNNDTGNDYDEYHLTMINGTTLAGVGNTVMSQPRCGVTTNGATTQAGGSGWIDIPNYAGSAQKQYTFQSGAASGVSAPNNHFLIQGHGVWNSTAAINRIDIAAVSGSQFNSGPFTLYAH